MKYELQMLCEIPSGGSKEALEMAAEVHDVDLADEGYLYNEKPANMSIIIQMSRCH